jgi:lysozyme
MVDARSASLLPGIDVGYSQLAIDWDTVASRAGLGFVIAETGHGITVRDSFFGRNWGALAAHGFIRGAYHFFAYRDTGQEQANTMLEQIDKNGGLAAGDFLAIDIEMQHGEPRDSTFRTPALEHLQEFVAALQETRHPVFIYTNPDTWLSVLQNPVDPLFSSCLLWLAWPRKSVPAISWRAWPNGWTLWQSGSSRRIPGISRSVDLDWYAGDRASLAALLGTVSPMNGGDDIPSLNDAYAQMILQLLM